MPRHPALSRLVPALAIAFLALGCKTEEKIVYTDPIPYNPPADAANGYVGYFTVSSKQATCGNCHAEYLAEWKETRHAGAYKSLTDLPAGSTQAFCFSCHTVSGRGNQSAATPAGYDKVADSTYRDVQCESCHGPGKTHIDGVNSASVVKPLARINLSVKQIDGVLTTGPDTLASCGACHTGVHTPFLEQWKESRHAMVRPAEAKNSGCIRCHEGRGALKSWGVPTTWSEGAWSATDGNDKLLPTVCAVCHDPHGGPNKYQTRFPLGSTDPSQNLCIKCHNNRTYPATGSSRGNQPHGAQGAVLLGFAGWRPPDFTYDTARIYGSHATSANPDLCAGCHVQRLTVNDPSGKFQFQSVGHLFKPIPCLDSKGIPTDDDSCAFTAAARSWNACTKSGCHADAGVAATVFNGTKAEVQQLVDFLWKNKSDPGSARVIDPYPTDDGYLPRIKASPQGGDLNPSDNKVTPADGCEFNTRMTAPQAYRYADHPDGSYGTHNAFLYRALLSQCASYLKTYYTFLPAPPANIQAIIDKWASPVMGNAPRIERVPLPVFDH